MSENPFILVRCCNNILIRNYKQEKELSLNDAFKIESSRKFSLVELLVVISIFSVLATLLFPSLDNMFYKGELLKCTNDLKSVYLGTHIYSSDYNDHYPKYGAYRVNPIEFGRDSGRFSDVDDGRLNSGAIIHLLRPYFDNMKDTFMCDSLANNPGWDSIEIDLDYEKNDQWRWQELPAGYALYFNATVQNSLGASYPLRASYPSNEWIHPDNIMSKVGDSFSFKPAHHPTLGLQSFDILASDYMLNLGAKGTHVPPNAQHMRTVGYRRGQFKNYCFYEAPIIENNLLFTDGSIDNYESVLGARTQNIQLYIPIRNESMPYFPKELASDP